MILLEIIFLIISITLFFLFKKLSIAKRVIISTIIFIILSVGSIGVIIWVGDKPLPGSVTVDLDDL
jgi:hypothetical protein